jgi:lipopolysaccharide export system protein LptC
MSIRANPVATLFPLLLLGMLAGLTYWLDLASRAPTGTDDGKSRHDPDYIVTQFLAKRFDTEGNLQHTLTAEELRHYPDDDSSEITLPHLIYHRAPVTTISARTAQISSKGEHVQLIDEVRIVRSGSADKPDGVLTTARLDTWPDAEIAKSSHPVTMTQGPSSIRGSGFSIDNTLSYFVLEGPVNGIFFRKDKAKTNVIPTSPPRLAQAARNSSVQPKSTTPARAKLRSVPKPTSAR